MICAQYRKISLKAGEYDSEGLEKLKFESTFMSVPQEKAATGFVSPEGSRKRESKN
jgi:hypothetical protein